MMPAMSNPPQQPRNVTPDEAVGIAIELYNQSCSHGFPLGCAQLGAMYQDALGVPRDVPHALALYEQACTAGAGRGIPSQPRSSLSAC